MVGTEHVSQQHVWSHGLPSTSCRYTCAMKVTCAGTQHRPQSINERMSTVAMYQIKLQHAVHTMSDNTTVFPRKPFM